MVMRGAPGQVFGGGHMFRSYDLEWHWWAWFSCSELSSKQYAELVCAPEQWRKSREGQGGQVPPKMSDGGR